MGGDWYERGIDLDAHLQEVVGFFETERESYWTRNADNAFLQIADTSGRTLLSGVESLIAPSSSGDDLFDWSVARTVADADFFAQEVRERIQITVAEEYCTNTKAMAERCLQLAKEVIASRPNEAVARYLRRLSRCYIAGFHPECVILCRAVLEQAVLEKFQRSRKPLPAANGKSEMRARLRRAEDLGWISRREREDAWQVWHRGSKAVHEDPHLTTDVLGTITTTMSLLSTLYANT